jgi:hypothetical protein
MHVLIKEVAWDMRLLVKATWARYVYSFNFRWLFYKTGTVIKQNARVACKNDISLLVMRPLLTLRALNVRLAAL